MTVITGYLNYAGEGKADLIERVLNECTSPYVENTIVKMMPERNKAFGIAMPKDRAILNYLLDDENESIVIIYGYVVKDGKNITATDIYGMNYDELLNLFKNAFSFYSILHKTSSSHIRSYIHIDVAFYMDVRVSKYL